jgi:hypothetical protein
LQQLAPGFLYVLLCTAVGAAQVVDAYVLSTASGRASATTTAFSFFEYVWAGASFYVWWTAKFEVPTWLPLSFVAYVAFMSLAGAIAVAKHRDELVLSPAVVATGGVFGAFFCVASTCVALFGE